jgi:hypothetical protein
MTHPIRFPVVHASILCAAFCFGAVTASAQSVKDVAGTYTLVSNITTDAAGKKVANFGDKPMGQLTLTPGGRYSVIITRGDLPKYASSNRQTGTAEEYKTITSGSLAHFGKYSVSDKTIVLHIESATFPNWNGTDQKRPLTLSGKDLKWTAPSASSGGTAELAWRRVD